MAAVRHPIAPAQWGDANRCGHCAHRTNAGMRMGHRPTNQHRPYSESGGYCSSCRRQQISANMALGGSGIRGLLSRLGEESTALGRSIPYGAPAPSGFEEFKCGGEMSTGPELSDFQSRIFDLFLNGRWRREEAKVAAKRPDWAKLETRMCRAMWLSRNRSRACRPLRLRARWPKWAPHACY